MRIRKIIKLITVLLLLCSSYFLFANDNIIDNSTFINSPVKQINNTIYKINKIYGIPKKQAEKLIYKAKTESKTKTDLKLIRDYLAQRDAENAQRNAEFNIRLKKLELSTSKDESGKQANADLKNGDINGTDTKTTQSYKQESKEIQQQTRAANALYVVRSNSLEQLAESLSKRKDETGKQANAELKNGDLNGAETKLMQSYKQEEPNKQECVEKQDELEKQECIEKQQQTRAADAYALAKVSILKSNYNEAETYYQQAVQLNPNNVLYTNSIPTYKQQLIFVINQLQPGIPQSTFTNPAIPTINQLQLGIPQTTFTNPAIPTINQLQPGIPQSTFTNPAIPNINQLQPGIPQSTFTNPAIPR
jgi:hypothetical protein